MRPKKKKHEASKYFVRETILLREWLEYDVMSKKQ